MEVPEKIGANAASAKARGLPPARSALALHSAQEAVRAEWQAMPPLPSGCGLHEAVNIVTQFARLPWAKHGHCDLKNLANLGWATLCGRLHDTMLSYGRFVRPNRRSGTMRYRLFSGMAK